MTYWEQSVPQAAANKKAWKPPHVQGKAVNIELAAYALMTYSSLGFGGSKGLPVLRWLTGQRNANGGFSSTQV